MINSDKCNIAMFSIHSDPLASLGSQQAGGQNIYVKSLAEELGRLGWKVDIFTRWDDPRKKQIANISKNARVIRLKGGETAYITKQELIDILPEIYNNFRFFCNFKNPYHIIHGHYWDGGWLATQAHKEFETPLAINFHSLGMIRTKTQKTYLKNGNEMEYFTKRLNIENEVIKEADTIISLAKTEKEDLCVLYGCPPEKIMVIPGGVNLKKWKPIDKEKAKNILGLNENDFVLLFVGRLEWRKGIGTLISATELLKKEVPNLKTLIVGGKIFGSQKNPEDLKEYKRLIEKAKRAGVEDIVKFVGRIDNSRLNIFYSACDTLVIPSYYEPFGLVALEGMSAQIPVIASRVGGLTNTIQDGKTGLLFTPRNPLELKEKIMTLYGSKGFVREIVKNAYERVKIYSWEVIAKEISDTYQRLIDKKNENRPACTL